MKITEIKAIDDLIKTLSFRGAFSLKKTESDFNYNIEPYLIFESEIADFNSSADAVFFGFQSILNKIEQQNQEEYINYFDYKFEERLGELKIYSGGNNSFYLFLKNKHGF